MFELISGALTRGQGYFHTDKDEHCCIAFIERVGRSIGRFSTCCDLSDLSSKN
jgi:hypothetical protein